MARHDLASSPGPREPLLSYPPLPLPLPPLTLPKLPPSPCSSSVKAPPPSAALLSDPLLRLGWRESGVVSLQVGAKWERGRGREGMGGEGNRGRETTKANENGAEEEERIGRKLMHMKRRPLVLLPLHSIHGMGALKETNRRAHRNRNHIDWTGRRAAHALHSLGMVKCLFLRLWSCCEEGVKTVKSPPRAAPCGPDILNPSLFSRSFCGCVHIFVA